MGLPPPHPHGSLQTGVHWLLIPHHAWPYLPPCPFHATWPPCLTHTCPGSPAQPGPLSEEGGPDICRWHFCLCPGCLSLSQQSPHSGMSLVKAQRLKTTQSLSPKDACNSTELQFWAEFQAGAGAGARAASPKALHALGLTAG
jgi:hypothetical protein